MYPEGKGRWWSLPQPIFPGRGFLTVITTRYTIIRASQVWYLQKSWHRSMCQSVWLTGKHSGTRWSMWNGTTRHSLPIRLTLHCRMNWHLRKISDWQKSSARSSLWHVAWSWIWQSMREKRKMKKNRIIPISMCLSQSVLLQRKESGAISREGNIFLMRMETGWRIPKEKICSMLFLLPDGMIRSF